MSQTRTHTLSRLFPPPNYLTFAPAAIDFSVDAIRVLKFKKDKIGLVPDFYREYKLTQPCEILDSEQDLQRCDEVRAILIALKKECNLKFVSVSLPESKTYIFKTSIPRDSISTAEETISFKIEENVPLDPQDVVFDYQIIDHKKNSSTVDVVVSTLPKKVIGAYGTLFKQSGLMPISFESESQSLARAVVPENDDSSYLILNMTEGQIGIAIVESNTVQYTSSIPVSSKDVVSDFSGSEAEALKQQINKLLIYWFTNKEESHQREKIETVILAGPYSYAPGLVEYLEKHLAIRAQLANVWENCFDLNDYVPSLSMKDSLKFGVVIGMALQNS